MPSEQEQLWLDLVIETGDPLLAVKTVYPECGKNASNPEQAIYTRMYQLRSKLKAEFVQRVQEKLLYYSPDLIKNLKELALSAQSEAVKVSASRDLLDRAQLGTNPELAQMGLTININRDAALIETDGKSLTISVGDQEEIDDRTINGEALRVSNPR